MVWDNPEANLYGRQTAMNLMELYVTIGSNYQTVLDRFGGHDVLLAKFVGSFLDDATYLKLVDAVQTLDGQAIESHAHTLKGVAGNLGFERLYAACGDLVSSVRYGRLDEIPDHFQKVSQEYETICEEIKNMIKN